MLADPMAEQANKGYLEASFIGFGFGCVLGGWLLGSAASLFWWTTQTMVPFAIGGVLGGIGGLVVGRVAGALLLD